METDSQTATSQIMYKDYMFSIVSMEIVQYDSEFYYLLWGTDNGYLYTFQYYPESSTNLLQNLKITAFGSNSVYLYSMMREEDSDNKLVSLTHY